MNVFYSEEVRLSLDQYRAIIFSILILGIFFYLLGDFFGQLLFNQPPFHISPMTTAEQVIGTAIAYSTRPFQMIGVVMFVLAVLLWNRVRQIR